MAAIELTTDAVLRAAARMFPDDQVVSIKSLGCDDADVAHSIEKTAGYGRQWKVQLADRRGGRRELVWHTASANEYGHDRRADRAAEMFQAFDDFARIPQHVAAVDLGLITADGSLVSCRGATEAYLVTTFVPGTTYAHDLRRIARDRVATESDRLRCDALARYLAELHTSIPDGATSYRRALRDLIGHGEGIFGIVDGYPDDVPGAAPDRLRALEERCASWRWRLRGRHDRLTRTHGDFHPFNVIFGDSADFQLLDASRGACGDPADDVTAMAVNFLLFALDVPGAWAHGLGVLWRRWWAEYLAVRDDAELLAVAPPFFAWRALVVCNPHFYPSLTVRAREALLGFAERVLDESCLDPIWAEELFE